MVAEMKMQLQTVETQGYKTQQQVLKMAKVRCPKHKYVGVLRILTTSCRFAAASICSRRVGYTKCQVVICYYTT